MVPGALVAVVALALALVLLWRRDRRRVAVDLAAARVETAELRDQVDFLARVGAAAQRQETPAETRAEYVITEVGEAPSSTTGEHEASLTAGLERIDGRLFADIVFRETLVKVAAVGGGLRRALAPETRNRIRFEMRREVKRSRRQRRAELRAARRLLHEQQRSRIDVTAESGADEDAA